MIALDNRELAFLIWLGVVVVLVVWYPSTRKHLPGLIKQAFASKLTLVFAGVALYALATVWLLWSLGVWSTSLISETVFWLLGPGIALVFGIGTRRDSDAFFVTTLKQVLLLTLAVEFVVNLYPLPLLGEILLVPILFFLFGAEAVSETRPEHRNALAPIRVAIAIVGFGLLLYTLWRVLREPDGLATAENARLLFLPLLLTICFIPFLYGLDLVFSYESAFLRIRLATGDRRRRRRAKLGLLSVAGPRTAGLRAFTPYWGNQLTGTDTLSATRAKAREFRGWAEERRLAPKREAERLERYAGVEGVDDEGRQLDQREFAETKKALQSLATAQMGWYRNRGGRYREDLVQMLAPQFERSGLPEDHGINLKVSKDGQRWWALRRTVTGWHFGIGAIAPPPDEWLFDYSEPPAGPPDEAEQWSQWGADSRNW